MDKQIKIKHLADYHNWERVNDCIPKGVYAGALPFEDGYVAACRVGNVGFEDKIHAVTYDSNLNLLTSEEVCKGEDPRGFLLNEIPFALFWSPRLASRFADFPMSYSLVNLKTKQVVDLSIDGVKETRMEVLGKNWMPLVKDGELFIVVSIEPRICVLKVNVDNGICNWLEGFAPVGNIEVTHSRGGTPFVYNETLERYVGFGHRTYSTTHHNIYFYTISKDFDDVYIGPDINTGKGCVQDPMSIFTKNGKTFFTVGRWNFPNEGEMGIYELIID